MVAQRQHGPLWTLEQYLEMERHSPIRREYVEGYVYAMAGGTRRHSLVSVNVTSLLRSLLLGKPCRVFNSDMRVMVKGRDHLYPDASVTCDGRDLAGDEADSISYPRLIFEVLAASTEGYDRGGKSDLYRACDTLEQYLLVETRQIGVELRTRSGGETWSALTYAADETVPLSSLGLDLPVSECYAGVAIVGRTE